MNTDGHREKNTSGGRLSFGRRASRGAPLYPQSRHGVGGFTMRHVRSFALSPEHERAVMSSHPAWQVAFPALAKAPVLPPFRPHPASSSAHVFFRVARAAARARHRARATRLASHCVVLSSQEFHCRWYSGERKLHCESHCEWVPEQPNNGMARQEWPATSLLVSGAALGRSAESAHPVRETADETPAAHRAHGTVPRADPTTDKQPRAPWL